jgi:diguanylate cyclase (GGDEF)-like protein
MIDVLIRFQLNIYGALSLVVLFVIIKIRTDVDNFPKRLLRGIIITNIAALAIEPVTFLTDGASGDLAYLLGIYSNALLYMMAPLLIGLWLNYVDYKIHGDIARLRRRYFHMHGVIIVFCLLVINMFTPVFYEIDAVSNRYETGPFLLVHHLIVYLMYAYAIVMVATNKSGEYKRRLIIVLMFFAIPFMGSILQLMNAYLFFTWPTLGLGALVAYVFLETSTGARDFLTGLYSRQSFEDYIEMMIERRVLFSLLLIDLDAFKTINDTVGHVKGDKVLIRFSEVLRTVFKDVTMIARLAGDEFVIVFEEGKASFSGEAIDEIGTLLRSSEVPEVTTLSFSYGHHRHLPGMDLDDVYSAADAKMYEMKRSN